MSKRSRIYNAAESAPYATAMAMVAEGAIPEKQKNYFNDNINMESFVHGIGEYISEAIDINAFTAHGKRLQTEFAENGFIKDIETGKALTVKESLSLLRVYGLIMAAGKSSLDMCFNEAPSSLPAANFNKNAEIEKMKNESKEIEKKLGPEKTKKGRELIISMTRIYDSIAVFKKANPNDVDGAEKMVKSFLEIYHEFGL